MSDSLRPQRAIDWGLLVTIGVLAVGGVAAFVVVREQGNSNTEKIAKQAEVDRDQNDRIRAIENNRSLETKLNDLTLEVRLLRQQVEMSNKDKRR